MFIVMLILYFGLCIYNKYSMLNISNKHLSIYASHWLRATECIGSLLLRCLGAGERAQWVTAACCEAWLTWVWCPEPTWGMEHSDFCQLSSDVHMLWHVHIQAHVHTHTQRYMCLYVYTNLERCTSDAFGSRGQRILRQCSVLSLSLRTCLIRCSKTHLTRRKRIQAWQHVTPVPRKQNWEEQKASRTTWRPPSVVELHPPMITAITISMTATSGLLTLNIRVIDSSSEKEVVGRVMRSSSESPALSQVYVVLPLLFCGLWWDRVYKV